MAQTWNTVRIFISSTFRDMHAERDHLVRVVFPELRERCAKRRLHLVDVNLRWGVTEEEAEQGKVLEVILDEIDHSRPFFVAMLGERYGSVPDRVPEDAQFAHPWLGDYLAHSLTALEIVHGVLRNPDMAGRSFFYLRDPRFIALPRTLTMWRWCRGGGGLPPLPALANACRMGLACAEDEHLAWKGPMKATRVARAFLLVVWLAVPLAACGGEGQEVRPAPTATTTSTEGPARSPSAAATGKIAFQSHRSDTAEIADIYVMNADGSGLIRLTGSPFFNGWADLSPDGTHIAFASTRDGNSEIYVMNADGSGVTRLTDSPSDDSFAHWSPDGTRIAFDSDRDGNWEIYVMNADGSSVTRLTDNPSLDSTAAWSPDGTRIAFESHRDGAGDIYVMNADGSGVARLTDNPALDGTPAWSPDGTRIVFTSMRDGNFEIYVMNADGSGVTRLTDNPSADAFADWSPDGTRIAFACERDGTDGICVMNADGSGVTRLTDIPGVEFAPTWSP